MGRFGDSMNLPFERGDYGTMPDDPLLSGGVVVLAAVAEIAGEPTPMLVFRFAKPDGTFYQPIALVTDDEQLAQMPGLVATAAVAALTAAGRGEPAT